jgi:pyruvate/2-oxoglutarate dehydrogenase complex dihydrolipoamide dehydrogenase (E3) component
VAPAKKKGLAYRVAKMPAKAVLRTLTLSETRGFLKMLIDEHSNKMLRFTAFGAAAGELIAVVQTGDVKRSAVYVASRFNFTHPTMAEGLTALLANVPVRPAS